MRLITREELANADRFGAFCPVYKIDSNTIVKTADSIRLTEAVTMEFVREYTTIPVSEVFAAYKDDKTGHVCIVMEFIEEEKLETAWNRYTEAEKESVLIQLR